MDAEWEVKRMFARGAFGTVFLIAPSSKSVGSNGNGNGGGGSNGIALKVFSVDKQMDAEQGKNEYVCLREVRANRVAHSIHAFGCCLFDRLPPSFAEHVPGKGPFMAIAMPFVDGTTLDVYLSGFVACHARPLPQEDCFKIVSSVAEFIVSGYRACGLVHGDIKPGNIMRNPTNDKIYVIDLTLGSCYARRPVGWHQGTTPYMPPERLLFFDAPSWASSAWAGATGDMWALGVVMATVYLTGEQMLNLPEFIAVLGPGRRFDPMITPTVFGLLWSGSLWFKNFVLRIQTATQMDGETVAQFYRLTFWRRACKLQPLWESADICSSPNFQVLNRFTNEAFTLYDANAGKVYEIVHQTMRQRMGENVYGMFVATQSLRLEERCRALGPEKADPPVQQVSEICTHMLQNLVLGISKTPCRVCGAPRLSVDAATCSPLCQQSLC